MLKKPMLVGNKYIGIIGVIAFAIYPIIFLYCNNVGEAAASFMLLPGAIYIGIGLAIWFVALYAAKSYDKAAIIAIITELIIFNYTFLESASKLFFSNLRYWHIVPILLVAILHLAFLIHKKLKPSIAKELCRVLSIVSCGLLMINVVTALPAIITKLTLNVEQVDLTEPTVSSVESRPNFYYIILDEYSNFDVMQKYYEYDNTPFAKQLEKLGFTVSYNSKNESKATTTTVTNSLNLDYIVNDKMTEVEKRAYRNDPYLFRLLESSGYDINNQSTMVNWRGQSGSNVVINTIQEDFNNNLIEPTLLGPLQELSNKAGSAERLLKLEQFEALKKAPNLQKTNLFTHAHIVLPHPPFLFDALGNAVPASEAMNWNDKRYYRNQYIFVTKKIEECITEILKNDPNAIVVLQSDHSARFLPGMLEEDKRHILNAVYYGSESVPEIQGQSGLNTLRLVINKLLDTQFSILEVPINDD